jgi:hypothetical protein
MSRFRPTCSAALCASTFSAVVGWLLLSGGCGAPMTEPATVEPGRLTSALTVASALRFDAGNAEVRHFADGKGWNRAGVKFTVSQADLVYTTDSWKTTRVATIQYLLSGYQGFILRDLAVGTEIEYAVHAEVAASTDGFRSYFDRDWMWANNGGHNYLGRTTDVAGR